MNVPSQTPKRHRRNLAELLRKAGEYRRVFGPRGYWLALRTKLTHNQRCEPAPIGSGHTVGVRLNSSDLSTFTKIFLNREYDVPLAKEPKVIVDAGANVGYASAFFSVQFPRAKIIALEPEAGNFDSLKRNTKAFPNVTAINAAIWPRSGQIDLLDPGMGSWGFEAAEASGRPDARHLGAVRAVSVDELMAEFDLTYIDILKVDIEGGEKALFEGNPKWVNRVGVVMIELHDYRHADCSRIFSEATRDFEKEIRQGENVIKVRGEYVR